MGLRSLGYGKGGVKGDTGPAPSLTIGGVTTLAAGASATAGITGGPAYTLNLGIPQGAAGSAASATPLGNATPLAAGVASAGAATNAAREDHRHPAQTGTLTLVGTATIGETTLISLSLGGKRYTGTMAGLAVGDRIMAFLTGSPGLSLLQDIYVSATNTYNVGLLNPALGIGAVIAVPIAVFKLS